MQRVLILAFGLVAYAVFFATFLYLIGFVGNLFVPYSIDAGREASPLMPALVINLGLIALFGVQHSVMARSGFKTWLKRMLPGSAERSVYVLMGSLVLALLMWQWRPMPETVWNAGSDVGQAIGWGVFALGFAIVLVSTFLIDHFELFGLKQVWARFTDRDVEMPRFKTPFLYKLVRHPIYLGFLLAFWGTPHMTVGHLVFTAGMTAYILVGTHFEERDLVRFHGADYERYKKQVPMILPLPRGRS